MLRGGVGREGRNRIDGGVLRSGRRTLSRNCLAARSGGVRHCDVRHSGVVRCFGRVFGNGGTVERDRGAGPARNGPPDGGFRAGSRVATVAALVGDRQWGWSRHDGSEPPRLDIGGDQQRL